MRKITRQKIKSGLAKVDKGGHPGGWTRFKREPFAIGGSKCIDGKPQVYKCGDPYIPTVFDELQKVLSDFKNHKQSS